MNYAYLQMVPVIILASANLSAAMITISRSERPVVTRDVIHELRVEQSGGRFKKIEVYPSDIQSTSTTAEEVEKRNQQRYAKLTPENLTTPLYVYGKIEK